MEEDGKLRVNFDEITEQFRELIPVVSKIENPQDFIKVVQKVTEKVFLKYFEFPNPYNYRPEDLSQIVQHVMDCINNITPPQIPYKSISIEGKWMLILKEGEDKKPN